MTGAITRRAKRVKKSDCPIKERVVITTDERTRRYEMRHTPAEFIKLYCNWDITPWPSHGGGGV